MLKFRAQWSGYCCLGDFFLAPRTRPCLSVLSLVVTRVFKCQVASFVENHRHVEVIQTSRSSLHSRAFTRCRVSVNLQAELLVTLLETLQRECRKGKSHPKMAVRHLSSLLADRSNTVYASHLLAPRCKRSIIFWGPLV